MNLVVDLAVSALVRSRFQVIATVGVTPFMGAASQIVGADRMDMSFEFTPIRVAEAVVSDIAIVVSSIFSVESVASSNGSVVSGIRECDKKYWSVSVSDVEVMKRRRPNGGCRWRGGADMTVSLDTLVTKDLPA